MLLGKEVDVLYTRERFEGKGPQYVLADAAIDIRVTEMKSMKDLIESKGKNRLREIGGSLASSVVVSLLVSRRKSLRCGTRDIARIRGLCEAQ